jgi:hypothetical protein
MSTCYCMGPQNGEPLCPCQMRAARQHLNVPTAPPPIPRGCVCPVGAEATCQGFGCPRKPLSVTF